jgi:N-acyl homoserine lactone hydrolase
MSSIRITPLHTGTLKRNAAGMIMGAAPRPIDLAILMFLVQTPDKTVLVDTGTRNPAETVPLHNPYEQTVSQRPEKVLAEVGLCPDDIDVVINTHLHWDHCSNNHLFKKATFYVQREELRYASAPLPAHAHGYEAFQLGLIPPFAGTKFEVLDGDCRILDGISVLLTPGHTPGFQSVLVESGVGGCILASDNIPFYENLRGGTIGEFTPSPIYVDLEDYYASIRRILALGLPVVPGHDIGVLSRGKLTQAREA